MDEDRPPSHTTKLYDNGTYKDSGYQSLSSSYAVENAKNFQKKSKSVVEEGKDPLSQSLPTWSLKTMKKENSVKCVYDSRLFKPENETKIAEDDSGYLSSCLNDVKEEPLSLKVEEPKKKESTNNKAFKDFLNASFSQTTNNTNPANHDVPTDNKKATNTSNKVCNQYLSQFADTF